MGLDMANKFTWEELKAKLSGEILHNEFRDGMRFIIMRGPASLCAYIGIPLDHPLAGFGYEDLPNVEAHGGLTFARSAEGKWPSGYYWYGWDYAHCDDYCFYYDTDECGLRGEGKKWLVEDVIGDSYWPLYYFDKLMKIAEKIASKR